MSLSIDEIYRQVAICEKCPLYKQRIVPYKYRGNPKSDIVFIGEGLGAEEQKQGLPFVGKSGKLLTKLLSEINITDDNSFITNLVKCRPPENRDPMYHEVKECQKYLIEELRAIDPKLIITVGKVPGRWFNHYRPFNWYEFKPEKRWLPVYHPAYLIRQKQEKKDEWKENIYNMARRVGVDI